jgi:protein-tyrosine phosphatase
LIRVSKVKPTSLLFVCMGNICRSPTAEGVMRKLVADAGLQQAIHIDSAGTHAYHIGHPPDERSQLFARKRGIELAPLRARQVTDEDFERFELVLAMDWDNLHLLEAACPQAQRHKLKLLMSYATRFSSPVVPDPYYGGDLGFETVLDYTIDACEGLLTRLVSA